MNSDSVKYLKKKLKVRRPRVNLGHNGAWKSTFSPPPPPPRPALVLIISHVVNKFVGTKTTVKFQKPRSNCAPCFLRSYGGSEIPRNHSFKVCN